MLDENDENTTTASTDPVTEPTADTPLDTAPGTASNPAAEPRPDDSRPDDSSPDDSGPDDSGPDDSGPDIPGPVFAGSAGSADAETSAGPAGSSETAGPADAEAPTEAAEAPPVAKKAARKRTTRTTTAKRTGTKKAAAADTGQPALPVETAPAEEQSAAARPDEPAAADGTPAAEDAAAEDAPVTPRKRTTRKTAAKKVAAKKAPAKRASKKAAAADPAAEQDTAAAGSDELAGSADPLAEPAAAPDTAADPLAEAVAASESVADPLAGATPTSDATGDQPAGIDVEHSAAPAATSTAPSLLFKAPDPVRPRSRRRVGSAPVPVTGDEPVEEVAEADVAGLQQVPDVAAADADGAGPHDDSVDGSVDDKSSDADAGDEDVSVDDADDTEETDDAEDTEDGQGGNRRRRRRGGRRRRRSGGGDDADAEGNGDQQAAESDEQASGEAEEESSSGGRGSRQRGSRQKQGGQKGSDKQGSEKQGSEKQGSEKQSRDKSGPDDEAEADEQGEGTGSRRRRRRRRTGEEGDAEDDSQNTVTRVRKPRNAEDEITALHGSTRLEAKKQRRREGREAGRRRAPIVSEAEFLARREAVDRVMVIRQRADLTQIAVLEDQVLVEHYVARESQTSLIGNVYLGRVQNVLPSMEAAFIDIGKGRNAVLYAGEVNWDSLGAGNGPRKIESVLKSGQPILVQVSKDPIGHKGARLTSQISLPGRFLVYVPDGTTSGISRKLPDTERTRLKTLLKEIVPDSAGVIVRTAAEGASEEELTLDVERLTARWTDIESKVEKAREKGGGPQLLYGEPDLTLKVVRDLFTEDFAKLVVSGDDAWDMVDSYVKHVAPDLEERLERYSDSAQDVFAAYRIDEQIAKGLDRKVWLPSGGSLIIDRTEAMTVVDVNTGKFTGSGGNLEETVTKNNLEAAEEMIRQLRLRDIGGIIVVDFIDMVLESNRDLVLRRLVECLGRDRTRHQVAEVTSLGLVQMTRKRIGTGLLEAFSENCEVCQGRGLIVHHEPVEAHRGGQDDEPRRGRRGRNRGSDGPDTGSSGSAGGGRGGGALAARPSPSPKDIAAMAKHDHRPVDEPIVDSPVEQVTSSPQDQAAQLPTEEPVQDGVEAAVGPDVSLVDEPVAVVESQTEPARSEAAAAEPDRAVTEPDHAVGQPDRATTESDRAVAEPGPVQGEPGAAQAEPEAAQPQPEAAQPEPAPVPKGPILVTSTRRRVARRPAGSATPAPRPEAAPEPVRATEAVPATESAPSHAAEPSGDQGPVLGAPAEHVPAAGPVLVTSTRRRVARRPAGPPVGAAAGGPQATSTVALPLSEAADGPPHGESDGSPVDPDGHPEDGHHESVHVPVKKRGSRKR